MRKLVLAAFFLGVMFASRAEDESYLYWMIDTSDAGAGAFDYSGIKIHAYNGEADAGYLNIGYENAGAFIKLSSADGLLSYSNTDMKGITAGGLYASLGSQVGDGYSYVVELFNDGVIGQSESLLYSQAAANSYIATVNSTRPLQPATLWVPQSYAVPEPNSALLMVLGCAALALRRRKMIKG